MRYSTFWASIVVAEMAVLVWLFERLLAAAHTLG